MRCSGPANPGRPITGTTETLDVINRDHLLDCLRRHYVAGGTLIVAAGRIEHRRVLKAVARLRVLSRRPPGILCARRDGQRAPALQLITKATEQTQLALGIRTCSRHDDRRFALRLLSTILGENMSSRLFQIVREDRGLAYSIYSTPAFSPTPATW